MTKHVRKKNPAARGKARRKKITGGPFRSAQRQDHNIVRSVTGRNYWKVKVMRQGKSLHKYFADSVWGGKSKALKAARAYRDSLMATTSGAPYVLWRRSWKTSRNTSGVVGVGRYVRHGGSATGPVWQAFWNTADGVRRSRTFAVNTHGERYARQLACEARKKGMMELRRELIRRGMTYGA